MSDPFSFDPGLPSPPQNYSPGFMSSVLSAIRRLYRLVPFTVMPHIHLSAPNGTVYRVSVDNTGTLTTAVADKNGPRPPL